MPKVDLHTHSTLSPDGGIRAEQYRAVLQSGLLDYVAITDHNTIALAKQLQQEFPKRIIVGEEIKTRDGEIIGLFLTDQIDAGMTVERTIAEIKRQGGLVYIPHPFETVRKGLTEAMLEAHKETIDIIEIHNGRALLQNQGPKAATWARLNRVAAAAASDAHGAKGLGMTYVSLTSAPTVDNLVEQLATARLVTMRPPLRTLLYPKAHRLRKRFIK